MSQLKNAVTLPYAGKTSVPTGTLPEAVCELIDAAEKLHAVVGQHAPDSVLPQAVEQEWKHLGECLAWLRR